jgi:hypothetical protein
MGKFIYIKMLNITTWQNYHYTIIYYSWISTLNMTDKAFFMLLYWFP